MKFEVFKASNGQYYWRLKAPNNEIVAQSEGYTAKASAFNAIRVVKSAHNAPEEDLTGER